MWSVSKWAQNKRGAGDGYWRSSKEGILLCYYYAHPYSAGLHLVIQNLRSQTESVACCLCIPLLVFSFTKVRREFKLRVRVRVREAKFYTASSF
jgi:hypothetical protein